MRRYYPFSKQRYLPPLVVTAQRCQLNTRGKKRTQGNKKIEFHSEIVGMLLWDRGIPWDEQSISPALLSWLICSTFLLLTIIYLSLTGREARTNHLMLTICFLYYMYAYGQLAAHVFLASVNGNLI